MKSKKNKENKIANKQKIGELKKQKKLMEKELDDLNGRTTKGKIARATAKAQKETKVKDYADAAVSIHHRLAAKSILKIEDIYEENLMLMYRGWSCYVDKLRDDIWENHNQIHILDFDFYDVDIFNRCQNSSDILMVVKPWNIVHPLLKIIPVEWEYNIPYGLLYSPNPSEIVQHFLSAVQTVLD